MAKLINSLQVINLSVGAKVIVEFGTPQQKIVTELIGFKEKNCILVAASKHLEAANSKSLEGKSLKVHVLQQGKVCTFDTRLRKIMPQPYGFWHLDYPPAFELNNVANTMKVEVNQPVAIEYQDSQLARSRDIPNIVYCRDMSLEGLTLEAPDAVGEIGDEFFVTKRLQVVDVDQMLLSSVILHTKKTLAGGVYRHFFKFVNIEDDNKIMIAAYIYQQLLAKLGYIED